MTDHKRTYSNDGKWVCSCGGTGGPLESIAIEKGWLQCTQDVGFSLKRDTILLAKVYREAILQGISYSPLQATVPMTDEDTQHQIVRRVFSGLVYDYNNDIYIYNTTSRRWQKKTEKELIALIKRIFDGHYWLVDGNHNPKQMTGRRAKYIISYLWPIPKLDHTRHIAPCWLDGTDRDVLPLQNGLLDIDTKELLPYSIDYFCPENKIARYDYDPDAKCPVWDTFIVQSFYSKTKYDDKDREITLSSGEKVYYNEDRLRSFRTACAMAISATKSSSIPILEGAGGAGKTMIAETLMQIVGNATSIVMQDLAGTFGLSNLWHRRFIVIDEGAIDYRQMADFQTWLLKLSGSGTISINQKNKPIMHLDRMTASIMISCNEYPAMSDDSGAWSRRYRMYSFSVQYDDDTLSERISGLRGKLDKELPGILNWILAGVKSYKDNDNRVVECKATKEDKDNYARTTDPLLAWADDCLDVGDMTDMTDTTTLYQSWKKWCEDAGINTKMAKQTLMRRMHKRLGTRSGERVMIDNKQETMQEGVTIKRPSTTPKVCEDIDVGDLF